MTKKAEVVKKYHDIEIGRFPSPRQGEEIVVRIVTSGEGWSVDIRTFYDGDKPTKKGFRIPVSATENFTELMVNATIALSALEEK